MESIKLRHMYNLHWSKIILLSFGLVFFTSLDLTGQGVPKGNYNFWEFRNKPFYFGLTVGLHSSGFIPSKSREFTNNSNITLVNGVSKPGLSLNIITNLKIGQYFDFRFIPGFSFAERQFFFEGTFPNPSNPGETLNFDDPRVESVLLETPLLLRFKSDPYKDKRFFVIGGLRYSFDVASNSRVNRAVQSDLLLLSPHDFQFEVGAGVQFFLPYFIFSPEIKFSRGLNNINIYNGELDQSRVLDSVISRAFTISFHFEG